MWHRKPMWPSHDYKYRIWPHCWIKHCLPHTLHNPTTHAFRTINIFGPWLKYLFSVHFYAFNTISTRLENAYRMYVNAMAISMTTVQSKYDTRHSFRICCKYVVLFFTCSWSKETLLNKSGASFMFTDLSTTNLCKREYFPSHDTYTQIHLDRHLATVASSCWIQSLVGMVWVKEMLRR